MKTKQRELETLSDYNTEAIKRHHNLKITRGLNGIACPDCGEEVYDNHPGTDEGVIVPTKLWVFPSAERDGPPRRHIHCRNCGWKGTRCC